MDDPEAQFREALLSAYREAALIQNMNINVPDIRRYYPQSVAETDPLLRLTHHR